MVVVDNCVLSSLAKIDRLDLLRKFFKNVETPFSVLREFEEEEIRGFEFVKRIRRVVAFSEKELSKEKWLLITPLKEIGLSSEIKSQSQVSDVDADCIAIAENRNKILLTLTP